MKFSKKTLIIKMNKGFRAESVGLHGKYLIYSDAIGTFYALSPSINLSIT